MKEWDTESPAACLIVINLLSVKQGIHNLEVKWDLSLPSVQFSDSVSVSASGTMYWKYCAFSLQR